MALKDLIVPKWKHSRVEVRLAAIDAVCNDLNILREIVQTDLSPQVRIAAIKKIGDESFLEAIIKSETDEQVLEMVKKQRESILLKIITSSRDQQAIIAALEKLDNEKLITSYLCDHTCDLSVQRTLIKKIKSHLLLSKITEHECATEVAEQIVEQVTEKQILERIAQRASNKKIRTIAQEKVDTLFTDPLAKEAEITRQLRQCCNNMDIKVSPQNYDQAVALLDISRSVWNMYDPQRCHPLSESYAAAEQLLIDRIKKADTQKIELEMLEQLCSKAEHLISEPAEILPEQLALLEAQWNAIDRTIIQEILTVSLDDRFKMACDKIRLTIQSAEDALSQVRLHQQALEQVCSELEYFADSIVVPDDRSWDRLLAQWDALCLKNAPDELLKARITDVKKKYQEKIDTKIQLERCEQQDQMENVERIVREMELLAQTEPQQMGSRYQNAIHLKREWNKSSRLVWLRKEELQYAFTTAYDKFMSTYHEFREQSSWKQWAADTAKRKILEEIEQLESRIQQGEAPKKIARKVSLFENQWRQATGGKSELSEIDDRFIAIKNHLYSMAMTKKNELFEILKTILAAPVDNNQSEEVKALQKQWNEIGYLPPELEKDLPDLFYGLCNTFFEQRKEQYQKYSEELEKNIAIREEICTEAAEISGSSEWKATKDAFARLQQRWDESWPAPHKRSQELWSQFSKSRDCFFERYHAFQSENDKFKEELCEKAEQLLAKLNDWELLVNDVHDTAESLKSETAVENEYTTVEVSGSITDKKSLASGGSVHTKQMQVNYGLVLGDAIKLQKSWKESGPSSMEHSKELWDRFNGTLKKVFSIIDDEYRKNYHSKETLVKEAEKIALSEEWDVVSERFQQIRTEWKNFRPAARRDEQALWNRLQAAGDTFFGRRRAHFDSQKEIIRQKVSDKEKLISELEILVCIAGKSQFLKTLQNQSNAEILKKGIELRALYVVEGDPERTYDNIKKRALEIIDSWESGEQLSGREYYLLEKRFDELLGILKKR